MLKIYDGENTTKKEKNKQKINKALDTCIEIVSSVSLATATTSVLTMVLDNSALMEMTAGTIIAGTAALTPIMYLGIKKLRMALEDLIHKSELAAIHNFDLELSHEYDVLIQRYNDTYAPWCLKNGYINPSEITWNMHCLKHIAQVIARDHEEALMTTNRDHTNYDLVSALVAESLNCALERDEDVIGPEILLSAVKTCEYLPENTKPTVIETVIKEMGFNPAINPYTGAISEEKGRQKIITFRSMHTSNPKGAE